MERDDKTKDQPDAQRHVAWAAVTLKPQGTHDGANHHDGYPPATTDHTDSGKLVGNQQ